MKTFRQKSSYRMMSYKNTLLLLVACIAGNAITVSSQCTLGDVEQENFDLEEFSGKWFPVFLPEDMYKDFTHWEHDFETNKDGNNITIAGVPTGKSEAEPHSGTWTLKPQCAKFQTNFPDFDVYDGNYVVVATDYTTYAIVQGCPKGGSVQNLFWISFREEPPKEEAVEAAKKAMEKAKLDFNDLSRDPTTL